MNTILALRLQQDLAGRLIEHNLGATPSTRPGRPWTLIYTEEFDDKTAAIRRENEIKEMKNRKYIENLTGKKEHQLRHPH